MVWWSFWRKIMSSRHIFSLLMTLVFFIYLGPNQLVNSSFNNNRVLIVLQLLCWLAQDYSRAFSINKKSTRREQADYRSYKMRGSESPQTKHVIDIPENSEKIVTIIQSSTTLKSSFQRTMNKKFGWIYTFSLSILRFNWSSTPYPGLVHGHYHPDPGETPSICGCTEDHLKCLPRTIELGP